MMELLRLITSLIPAHPAYQVAIVKITRLEAVLKAEVAEVNRLLPMRKKAEQLEAQLRNLPAPICSESINHHGMTFHCQLCKTRFLENREKYLYQDLLDQMTNKGYVQAVGWLREKVKEFK